MKERELKRSLVRKRQTLTRNEQKRDSDEHSETDVATNQNVVNLSPTNPPGIHPPTDPPDVVFVDVADVAR